MENDRTPLPFVVDLHSHPQNIAELALECLEIGIDHPHRIAGACALARIRHSRLFFAARTVFGLPPRQSLRNDLASKSLGIIHRRNGAGMTHGDIASHERLAYKLRKIEQSQ